MDEVQFFRHYVQPFSGKSTELACRHNDGGNNAEGSSEGISTPRSAAYGPNKNIYGKTWGTMAKVYAGQQLCWRWPAKNHFAHVNVKTNPLHINWDDVPNRPAPDLTQAQMDTKRLTSVLWANCPVPGPASSGDTTGTGSELRPCGGCFTVPNRAPGIYTVQWEWPFHTPNTETYTSCADIEILAGTGGGTSGSTSGGTTTGGTTTGGSTAVTNCAVSAWSGWGTCSSNCGSGKQTRTRTITTQPSVGGTACPTLTETQSCNTQSCSGSSFVSEHVVYEDSLVDFTDWSWATPSLVNLASTSVARSGSSIAWTPSAWQGLYFHYDVGLSSITEYQSISFWLNGGTRGGQSVVFSLVVTTDKSTPLFNYVIPKAKLAANTWNQVTIKFSDLKLTKGNFDGFWFQANSAATQTQLFIDDIYFMHVHTGGVQALQNTDTCANVACPVNSKCLGGECSCANGYFGDGCTEAPEIGMVEVKSVTGNLTSALNGGEEMLMVSWEANGTMPQVSILLFSEDSEVPEVLASQITNEGSYTWMVPASLAAGTYTIRVSYSNTVYGTSAPLTKTTAADTAGCSNPDCNGHGECNEDTVGVCVCRFGYTGSECSEAPAGVTKIRASIVVNASVTHYNANPAKFMAVLKKDLASGLVLSSDQIEIVSVVAQSQSTSLVTYDIVTGGEFPASALAITDVATYQATVSQQLADDDSSLNRGTYSYAAAHTGVSDSSAAYPSASTSTLAVGVAIVAAAAIVL